MIPTAQGCLPLGFRQYLITGLVIYYVGSGRGETAENWINCIVWINEYMQHNENPDTAVLWICLGILNFGRYVKPIIATKVIMQ